VRWLRWFLRRDLLVADAALVGGIAAAGIGLIGGIVGGEDASAAGSLRILGVFAIVYGVVWILLYAALSSETAQSERWTTTQTMMRLADLAVFLPAFIVLSPPTYFGGPMHEVAAGPFGVPWGAVMLAIGFVGVVTGWIWIRLIARGEPEPAANDRFWWSRA
jgi:hypothetical protein